MEERLTAEEDARTPPMGGGRRAPKSAPAPQKRTRAPRHSDDHRLDASARRDTPRVRDEIDEDVERFELSDDDRVNLFRDSIMQSVLPDIPAEPDYHVCWLSTSNARDPITRRLMLGYQLIRADELPRSWRGATLKTGDYAGCVGINEMVAAKIPMRIYQRFMEVAHYEQPLQEEEKLRERVELMKQQAVEAGSRVLEGDGTAQLVQRARPPKFTT